MTKKDKPVRRMVNVTEIRFESRDKVEDYRYELEEILDIIGHPDAFITDRSTTGDFFDVEEDEQIERVLQEMSDQFCIRAPQEDEFLVGIAERVRQARRVR